MAKAKTVSAPPEGVQMLKQIEQQRITLRIVGTSPLVAHKWSEKAIRMIQEKHAGKKTKNRDVREPEAEYEAAMYKMPNGKHAIPGMALKRALISAAHKDIGIEKTLVRKAVFIPIHDATGYLPMDKHSKPFMRTDVMRVGVGATDLRYRPQYDEWSVVVSFEIDSSLLTPNDLINLINRAGFGIGILEGRPEVGRDFGRFKVDETYGVTITAMT